MDEILGQVLQVGFFAAMIRIATPLLFATIGELFAERSGVLNLGIEGIMLLSAMTGFSAALDSFNPAAIPQLDAREVVRALLLHERELARTALWDNDEVVESLVSANQL